ncbi:MAG: AAA family ATPase, partial [Dethiobacteria bacterium]|nr:AAA family ATPase [Dethiobacteria bacterium]
TEEQLQVLEEALENGVLVVTGGPGTGKTTTIKALLSIFQLIKQKVLLAAPTGRAAKRVTEATGEEAFTIHRMLEYSYTEGEGFRFQRNEKNPVDAQVVIVDEASMVDLLLMYNLLKALPVGCRLIMVGDVDQLPAVGAGNVLRDLISSGTIPCFRLGHIFRQARESMIIVNAHRVNQGEMPYLNLKNKDFFFIHEEDPENVAQMVVQLCRERLPNYGPYDPLLDLQVLTPMRKTAAGVDRLNLLLQQALNPAAREKVETTTKGTVYRLGDKVMQIRNNYQKEVFNGDIGLITAIDREEAELVVTFRDLLMPRPVVYDFTELDELVLSYAVSVHKSQGSEYPVIIMPVLTQHYMLLQRNLLYTGITRARKLAVLVGSKKALAIAVRNNRAEERYSYLGGRLRPGGDD